MDTTEDQDTAASDAAPTRRVDAAPVGDAESPGPPAAPVDPAAPVVQRNRGGGDGADAPEPRRRSRLRRALVWSLAVPLVLLVALVAAWAIDNAVGSDTVARNTEVAGTPVGGMTEAELTATVEDLAGQLPSTEVVIDASDLTVESTAGALGLGIDVDATVSEVMDVRTDGRVLTRPFEWAASFFSPREADVAVTVDETTLDATLTELEGDQRSAPVEPTLAVSDGAAVLVPGEDGIQLTATDVVGALPSSLGDVNDSITVTTERTVVPPTTSDDAVQPIVDEANAIRARTITVTAGEQSFTLEGQSLVDGFALDTSSGTPALTVAEEVIGQQIAAQEGVDANPTDVTFALGGGGLAPVPGHDAQVCCGEGATAAILAALLAGQETADVPARTYTAAEGVEWASTLGVNQVVSEFTTPHPCCQGRVSNIHTIADRIRGTLIPPGATFSVNDLTGPRTADKGYVAAPAIVDGEHVQDVGGGVSQYATTMFNAAFFAGLDITEYKMHSEYISRYPYGREATLFYSSVDLKVRNNTPYGIVIWPTYTGTSVTVQLWSTPYARGEQTGQSKSSGCGTVTTERTTTFPDGRAEVDTFRANYRCT